MGRSLKRMHNYLANKDKEGPGYQVVVSGWYKVTSPSNNSMPLNFPLNNSCIK